MRKRKHVSEEVKTGELGREYRLGRMREQVSEEENTSEGGRDNR